MALSLRRMPILKQLSATINAKMPKSEHLKWTTSFKPTLDKTPKRAFEQMRSDKLLKTPHLHLVLALPSGNAFVALSVTYKELTNYPIVSSKLSDCPPESIKGSTVHSSKNMYLLVLQGTNLNWFLSPGNIPGRNMCQCLATSIEFINVSRRR